MKSQVKRLIKRVIAAAPKALRVLMAVVLAASPTNLGVGVSSAQAQSVPTLMSFQGRLTDASNNPLSGSHSFVFEIFNALTGGTSLWTETQPAVTVTNGVFAVQLGAVTPLSASVFYGGAAYLQITADGVALSPRERLITSPYAFSSKNLDGRDYTFFVSTDAATQSIAGAKTFTGSITVPAPTASGHSATKAYVDAQVAGGGSGWVDDGTVVRLADANDNVVVASTMTISGNAFSVGGSTLAVKDGKVGIGTTSPSQKLHVDGNIQVGTSGNIGSLLFTGNPLNTKSFITLAAVGAADINDLRLNTNDYIRLSDDNGNTGADLKVNGYTDQADKITWVIPSVNAASGIQVPFSVTETISQSGTAGYTALLVNPTESATGSGPRRIADFQVGGTSRFLVESAGNVGVGVTNPATLLHLGKSAAPVALRFDVIGSGAMRMGLSDPNTFRIADSDNLASNVLLQINRLDGNVGIGTTAPAAKLHISSGTLLVDGNASTAFQVGASSFIINSVGSVGVGTSSPGAKLHVEGGDVVVGPSSIIHDATANADLFVQGNLVVDGRLVQHQGVQSTMESLIVEGTATVKGNAFSVGGSTLAVSSGRLGIGTGAPANRLHVVGAPTALSDFIRLSPDGTAGSQGVGIGIQIEAEPTGQTTPFAAGRLYGVFDANTFGSERMTFQSAIGGVLTDTLSLKNGRAGIDTISPATDLQVGNHDGSLNGSYVVGNSPVLFQTLNNNGGSTPSAGEPALLLARTGVGGQAYSNYAALELKRFENSGTNSRTQLDIRLTHAVPEATPPAIVSMRSNGNVGIGATSPTATLHVSSDNASALGTPLLVSSGTSTGQELLVVKGDGKIGIGTTAPGSRLHIVNYGGAALIEAVNTDNNPATFFIGTDNWTTARPVIRGAASATAFFGNYANAPVAIGTNNDAGQFVILNGSGNVGIATVSPTHKLDVSGGGLIVRSSVTLAGISSTPNSVAGQGAIYYDTEDAKFKVSENGGAYADLVTSGASAWTKEGAVIKHVTATDNVVIQSTLTVQGNAFSVGGSTLTAVSGNVGVGTTNPGAKLDVIGPVQFSGGNVFATIPNSGQLSYETSLGATRLIGFGPNATTTGKLQFSVSESDGGNQFHMVLGTTGNVGIGTTDPLTKLDVTGPIMVSGASVVNTVANSGQLSYESGMGATRLIGFGPDAATTGKLRFTVSESDGGGQQEMILTNTGDFGVGTVNPAAKLDVAGSAQFGSGATKSTFTAAGNLQLVSGSTITSNGALSISTAASAALTGTPALSINASGNVAIGTSPATTRLYVQDSANQFRLANDSNRYATFDVDSNAVLTLRPGFAGGPGESGLIKFAAPGYWAMSFNQGNTITSTAGNISIGNGNDLIILGNSGKLKIGKAGGGSPAEIYADQSGSTQDVFFDAATAKLKLLTAGTERAVIDIGGRMGVGATAPAARLHVSSAGAVAADTVFQVSSGTATGQELVRVKGDGDVLIGSPAIHDTSAAPDLLVQGNLIVDGKVIQHTGAQSTMESLIVEGTATVKGNAFSVGGSTFAVDGGTVSIGRNLRLADNLSTLQFGASNDVILSRDAANILAQRNGTSSQEFRVYRTLSGADSQYIALDFNAGDTAMRLRSDKTGASTVLPLEFFGQGQSQILMFDGDIRMQAAGGGMIRLTTNALWPNDGTTMDLGLSSADHAFRDLYLQNSVNFRASGATPTTDVTLQRGGANTLALVRGTNPQEFRVYRTTSGADSEFMKAGWNTAGLFQVNTSTTGAGSRYALFLSGGGTYPNEGLTIGNDGTARFRGGPLASSVEFQAGLTGGSTGLNLTRLDSTQIGSILGGDDGTMEIRSQGQYNAFFGRTSDALYRPLVIQEASTDAAAYYSRLKMGFGLSTAYFDIQAYQTSSEITAAPIALNPSGGSVGIGTTSPTHRLDVSGGGLIVRSSVTLAEMAAPPLSVANQGAIYFDSTADKFKVSENAGSYVDLVPSGASAWTKDGAVIKPVTTTDNVVVQSTLTVQGNAFSVGGSTLAVTLGQVGMGTTAPKTRLHLSTSAAGSVDLLTLEQNDATAANAAGLVFKRDAGKMLGRIVAINQNPGADRSQMKFYTNNGGASVTNLSLLFNGDAGFGVEDPQAKLEIGGNGSQIYLSGSTDANRLIANNPGTAYMGMKIYGTPGTVSKIGLGYAPNILTLITDVLTVTNGDRVGIGNASPSTKLHVTSGTVMIDGDASTSFQIGASTLVVRGDGNVGIGTTAPSTRVNVSFAATGGENGLRVTGQYPEVQLDSNDTTPREWRMIVGSGAGADKGKLRFVDAGAGLNVMTMVHGTGNVGVMYTDPFSTMTVAGALGMTGIGQPTGSAAGRGIIYYDTTANKLKVSENNGAFVDLVNQAAAGGWTDGGTDVTLTAIGDKVGIGKAAPTGKLHVSSGTVMIDGDANISFQIGASTLVVRGDGRVGVGTTVPASKFHIKGDYNNTGAGGFMLDANDDADLEKYVLRINPAVIGGGKVGYQFQTKSSDGGTNVPLAFDNAGKVGIGISNPGARLEVSGDVKISSSLAIVGSAGAPSVSGAGTRFLWIPSSAAVRGGIVSGVEWDATNVGPYSVAFGSGTKASGIGATASGGVGNVVGADYAVVGGGQNNAATDSNATVAGGWLNRASSLYTAVGGGQQNTASNSYAFVGGGWNNTAGGSYSSVAGGLSNEATGDYAFAGGRRAKSTARGSFLWADSANADLFGDTTDQFRVRAQGGFLVSAASATFTNASSTLFSVDGTSAHFKVPVYDQSGSLLSAAAAGGWTDDGTVVRLTASGDNVVVQSTLTVQGAAFSVANSTLSVSGGLVGIGTTAPSRQLTVKASAEANAGADFLDNSGNTMLTLRPSSGRIGVFNNNPAVPLDIIGQVQITGTGASSFVMRGGSGNTGFEINTAAAAANGTYLGSFTDTKLRLQTNSLDRMTILNTGQVGIATGTPTAQLDVNGDAHFGSGATKSTFTTTGNLQFVSGSTLTSNGTFSISTAASAALTGVPALFISAAGNLSVGTTQAKTADGSARTLQVGNNFIMQNVVGNQVLMGHNAYYDGTWKRATADTAQSIRTYGGDMVFHLAATGAADSTLTTWDSSDRRMIIKADGSVGVGTVSPGAIFEVQKNANSNQNVGRFFNTDAGAASEAELFIGQGAATGKSLAIRVHHTDQYASLHMWGDASGSSLVIKKGGNVGIGTTNPFSTMTVTGALGFSAIGQPAGPAAGRGVIYYDTGTNKLRASENNGAFTDLVGVAGGGWADDGTVVRLTSAGDNVVVQSTLTVQGNAFSVGASTLVVKDGNTGMGTTDLSAINTVTPRLRISDTSANQANLDIRAGSGLPANIYLSHSDTHFVRTLFDGPTGSNPGLLDLGFGSGVANPAVRFDVGTTGTLYMKAGKVGIGTTNPAAKLHMSSGTLFIDGDAATSFQIGASTLVVTGSGNVGIGTSDPAAALGDGGSPRILNLSGGAGYGLLRLTSTATGAGVSLGGITFGSTGYSGGEKRTAFVGSLSDDASTVNPTGHLQFWTTNAGTIAEKLRITAGGNVGIGNTTPSAKLHVSSGTVMIDGDAATSFQIGASTLVVTGSGNVGIGITNPGSKFEVNHTGNNSAYIHTSGTSGAEIQLMELRFTGVNNPAENYEWIRFVDDDAEMGRIEGTGAGGVTYGTTSGDFAEWMPQRDASEALEPGDIVGVRDGRIAKDTKIAASILVVSQAPGFLGNSPKDEAGAGAGKNVAMVGQVPVKVRGRVRQGDYILPSGHHDGVGVARSKSEVSFEEFKDRVVGVAWEDSLVEGIKVVNVAIGIK